MYRHVSIYIYIIILYIIDETLWTSLNDRINRIQIKIYQPANWKYIIFVENYKTSHALFMSRPYHIFICVMPNKYQINRFL